MPTGKITSVNDIHSAVIQGQDGVVYFVPAAELRKLGHVVKPGDLVDFRKVPPMPGTSRPRATNLILKTAKSSLEIGRNHRPTGTAAPPASQANRGALQKESEELHRQAQDARKKKEYDRARNLFERALEKNKNLQIFLSLCAMERDLAALEGNYDRAQRAYERALEQFPTTGQVYGQYGALFAKAFPEKAIRIFREGLKKDPAHKVLHKELAQALFATKDPAVLQEAEQHFDIASKANLLDAASDLQRKIISVLRGHVRGRVALRLFDAIGFSLRDIGRQNIGIGVDFEIYSPLSEYVEAYDLSGVLSVRCYFKNKPVIEDINSLIGDVKQAAITNVDLNPAVVLLIAHDIGAVRDYLYRLLEQPGKGPTIVPLSESMVNDVLVNAAPKERFKRHLDEWLYKRDLYEQNFPVSGREFFGRELELAGLVRNIEAASPVGLFGLRKVGKTSLLKQLREKRPHDLVAYIDLQSIPDGVHDASYVYWVIANQLYQQLRKKYPQITHTVTFRLAGRYTTFHSVRKPESNAANLDADLHELKAAIRNSGYAPFKLIIMLDEVETLLPMGRSEGFRGYESLFRYLRGISQEDGFVVSIVTGANPAICDTPQWAGRDNPVFKFYKEMFLPPLEKHECLEMVQHLGKGMGISFTDKAQDRIYRETGGHPFITRQLCSRIAKHFKDRPLRVDVPKVEKGVEEFLFNDADIFKEIMERLGRDFPNEKELLTFIASGVTILSDLESIIPTAGESLRHLMSYQLIGRKDDSFFIRLELFTVWIKKYWLNVAK